MAVARGAMYAPWIFAEICGNPMPDKKRLVLNQIDDTQKYFGERFACVFMRKMCAFYLKGQPNSAVMRERLFKCSTVEELKLIVNTLSF